MSIVETGETMPRERVRTPTDTAGIGATSRFRKNSRAVDGGDDQPDRAVAAAGPGSA
ncbi:hypothetical protein [Nocardia sp. NPDC004123]